MTNNIRECNKHNLAHSGVKCVKTLRYIVHHFVALGQRFVNQRDVEGKWSRRQLGAATGDTARSTIKLGYKVISIFYFSDWFLETGSKKKLCTYSYTTATFNKTVLFLSITFLYENKCYFPFSFCTESSRKGTIKSKESIW